MDELTPRQQEILDFIRARVDADGVPPTLVEIAQAFGFADPSSAQHFVSVLVSKGALLREPGKRRNLRVLDADGRIERRAGQRVPLIGRVAAGLPILAQENIERSLLLDPEVFHARADFALRVQGDSMRDAGILDGDWVIVQRSAEARSGQIVVARLDDEVTLKRFKRSRGSIELWPENPDYPVLRVDPRKHSFAIEGIQIGLLRQTRP